jgi:uncharacterized protein YndB with AHSA1/START domain
MLPTMRVQRDVVLDTTLQDTWELLTDPDELAAWLGTPLALDVRPGGAAAYVEPDGTTRHAVIEQVDEGERLSFIWWEPDEGVTSRVVFELTPVECGTRVAVTETRASIAGPSVRLHLGALWDERLFDLERHCITRQFALV